MKIRIKGNSVRLRLSKSEVETFRDVGRIEEFVGLGKAGQPDFRYAIESGSKQTVCATFEEGKLSVLVPLAIASQWVNSEQVGFESNEDGFHILVEKDFVCLKPRKGEDESDNYPHPESHEGC